MALLQIAEKVAAQMWKTLQTHLDTWMLVENKCLWAKLIRNSVFKAHLHIKKWISKR